VDLPGLLRANAATCARVALENISREFPSDVHHTMARPGDFPLRPRERTPVFFGSLRRAPAQLAASGAGAGTPSRQRLVMGSRRSRPKFFCVILGPGGYCRRLYSAVSTSRMTRCTSSGS
jgi:Protein of unknown function (DUF2891)